MTLILGIDDAGRGPVIGPMILAGVLLNKEDEKILQEWGAKDSKLLLPTKRKQIADKIKQNFKYHIELSTPEEIDNHTNLNYLEAEKAAKIIDELLSSDFGNNLSANKVSAKGGTRAKGTALGEHSKIAEKVKVIIDCPSINPKSWQDYLVQKLKTTNIELSCEHKADLNYPVVSAASIIAKEKREDELKILKKQLNVEFGSGYPSDPTTVEFIKSNFKNPKFKDIIRHSWNTIKRLHKSQDQKKLF